MKTYAIVSLGLCIAVPAAAEGPKSFRCGTDLVQLGDNKASATLKCGKPIATDSFCKPPPGQATKARGVAGCETVDEWTYNPGYGQFYTTLRFESGRLVSIRYGDRVK
jgi:hypothetical protein